MEIGKIYINGNLLTQWQQWDLVARCLHFNILLPKNKQTKGILNILVFATIKQTISK